MGDGMSPYPPGASTAIVAVDTGGTFTDLLLVRDGTLEVLKVPSTPEDPAEAVLAGIRTLVGTTPFQLVHGSTVATNALLERTGARVVLVTNRGLEDVIEIGRQDRPQLYELVGHREPPLVGREDRIGIGGRLGADGLEVSPIPAEDLSDLPRAIAERGAEAVAVCLLHSYLDRTGEEDLREALSRLGIPVSVSSEILPEFREYERTSTTVVNAYVQPMMARYLTRLEADSGAEQARIMASNGGSLSIRGAVEQPVQTVVSGPAGGVVGASRWAELAGFPRAITFDMGGTSTDVSVVPGRLLRTREFSIGAQPVSSQVLDIHTVGAGGGSIARVDAGGALRVGPESAGSRPGPICYGLGGTEVTVTDAHVWLGRIPVTRLPGAERDLDRDAVSGPLSTLADAVGMDRDGVARGILEVANATMERAIRVVSVERGYDPIDFMVVGFGGAGGLHAAELADRIGAAGALIPPHPGLLSAYGMLVAPVSREVSRTVLVSSNHQDAAARLRTAFEELAAEARAKLSDTVRDGGPVHLQQTIDARYQGQSFELAVPAEGWIEAFHREHEVRYGYREMEAPVEAVTVRVTASLPGVEVAHEPPAAGAGPSAEAVPAGRSGVSEGTGSPGEVRSPGDSGTPGVSVLDRASLGSGATLPGPCVITGYGATTWVPDAWRLEVDALGALVLTRMETGS